VVKIDFNAANAPFNLYFEEAGYKTKYLIANLGSTFLYFVAIISIVITIPIFEAIGKRIIIF